ncbi:unnamed protein product [Rotaria sordida]|uniref:EGF-like domain-containing protein n=2 Tax=Rotaria sordida TaxID=392033 RepID=A0A814XPY5_9BILA|nr:unnamed protein product [Rotaria sordida]CAF3658670.1 unnamed protein product [Rotaria sordida]
MPNMYRCVNSSKCISKYRLNDGISDCYFDDDENYVETENICSSTSNIKCYECRSKSKSIHYNRLKDGLCDCPHYCDDEVPIDHTVDIQEHISFQTICDGFTELLPIMIDGQNETDETNCGQWVCDNIYTHCDIIWNCLNGADELNCPKLRVSNCTSNEHPCVSLKGNEFMCLPIEKANDGVVDCLGATDEPHICRAYRLLDKPAAFYCENRGHLNCINHLFLCNNQSECNNDEDERFCSKYSNYINSQQGVCGQPLSIRSEIEEFLCWKFSSDAFKQNVVYFKLGQNEPSIVSTKNSVSRRILPSPNQNENLQRRCNRGMDMRVWLGDKDNSTTTTCLCPPSYYGDTCQYQNQRVSLTLQVQPSLDIGRVPLAIVLLLIDDDEKLINSYEQFTYIPKRDCNTKFNVYFLYSTKPKNSAKNYSIHIDIYEKRSILRHHASWLISLNFNFMPVQRTAVRITIPQLRIDDENCVDPFCIHGQCIKYVDDAQKRTFCRCNQGWSGRNCTIPQVCTCSSDSLCVGISANNRSVCVCPLGKFGSRCLIENQTCRSGPNATCENGGQCIPNDERVSFDNPVTCSCPEGSSGDRCEKKATKIQISFHNKIVIPQVMFVHFIYALGYAPPEPRCHTNLSMDVFLSQPTTHNHAPNPDRIPVIQLHNEVKQRAATTDEPTSSILHSALRTFPLRAAGELPRTDIIIQTIRRQRTTPAIIPSGHLPEDLKKTYRGEDFLLYEDNEMIIFTTKTNLSILKQSKHWFADGTFKVSYQLRNVQH